MSNNGNKRFIEIDGEQILVIEAVCHAYKHHFWTEIKHTRAARAPPRPSES